MAMSDPYQIKPGKKSLLVSQKHLKIILTYTKDIKPLIEALLDDGVGQTSPGSLC